MQTGIRSIKLSPSNLRRPPLIAMPRPRPRGCRKGDDSASTRLRELAEMPAGANYNSAHGARGIPSTWIAGAPADRLQPGEMVVGSSANGSWSSASFILGLSSGKRFNRHVHKTQTAALARAAKPNRTRTSTRSIVEICSLGFTEHQRAGSYFATANAARPGRNSASAALSAIVSMRIVRKSASSICSAAICSRWDLGVQSLDRGECHPARIDERDRSLIHSQPECLAEVLRHGTQMPHAWVFFLVLPARDRQCIHLLQDLVRIDRPLRGLPVAIRIVIHAPPVLRNAPVEVAIA